MRPAHSSHFRVGRAPLTTCASNAWYDPAFDGAGIVMNGTTPVAMVDSSAPSGRWMSSRNPDSRNQRERQNRRCVAAISAATSGTGPITRTSFCPRANTSRQGRSSVGFSAWLPVSASRSRSLMP